MHAVTGVVLVCLAAGCVQAYPGYWTTPSLNPVHGLFIKPSSDGATGDLFVAATENNGVKSQWAVDQPINFFQVASATQPHVAAVPVPYPGFPKPQDECSNQKRSVPTPVQTPPVQYAYALPVPSTDSNAIVSYPYAYPILTAPTETTTPKSEPASTNPQHPYQFPFQFFYPQMMSAYSKAMNILKDAGLSEDTANSVMAQTSPMWPSSYSYPMYVMVDPTTWLQNQETTTCSTSTQSPSTQEEENTQG